MLGRGRVDKHHKKKKFRPIYFFLTFCELGDPISRKKRQI